MLRCCYKIIAVLLCVLLDGRPQLCSSSDSLHSNSNSHFRGWLDIFAL